MNNTRRFRLAGDKAYFHITLESSMVDFLGIRLGLDPYRENKQVRLAVRQWLQAQVDKDPGAFIAGTGRPKADRAYNARRLFRLVLLEIVDPALRQRVVDLSIADQARRTGTAV